MSDGRIFISYRRGIDGGTTGRLHDRLERHFGKSRLFMDVDDIPLGIDFVRHLDEQVARCDVFLVVIGPGWVDAAGRLANPDDFVRIEIESALRRPEIPIVPVFIDGATLPGASELPESLRGLVHRHGIEVRHENFSGVVDGRLRRSLLDAIDRRRVEVGDEPRSKRRRYAVLSAIAVAVVLTGLALLRIVNLDEIFRFGTATRTGGGTGGGSFEDTGRSVGVTTEGPAIYAGPRAFYADIIEQRGLSLSQQQLEKLALPRSFDGKRLKLLDFSSFEGANLDQDFWCAVTACDTREFGPGLVPQSGPAPRESTMMAHSGAKSMNFAPETLGQMKSNGAIAKNRHRRVFDVRGADRVWIRFWTWSNTNPHPASIHNCDSSLNLYYRLDRTRWTHLTSICGSNPLDPGFSANSMQPFQIDVLLNGAKEFEIGFAFEGQNIEHPIAGPAYLVDDLLIFAEW